MFDIGLRRPVGDHFASEISSLRRLNQPDEVGFPHSDIGEKKFNWGSVASIFQNFRPNRELRYLTTFVSAAENLENRGSKLPLLKETA